MSGKFGSIYASRGPRRQSLSQKRKGPSGSWDGLHPGLRAGLILGAFLLANMVIVALTGGTSLVACYLVQVLLYAANGVLAAYFAVNTSGYDIHDLAKVGAVAGLVGWALNLLLYLVAGPILGLVTMGWAILGVTVGLLCAPIDLAIQIGSAALGAWIYGRATGSYHSYR